jgi:hypothetical protein
VIVYVGAGVLAWTAARMILNEPLVKVRIAEVPWTIWVVDGVIIGGVLLSGWLRHRKLKRPGIVFPEHPEDRLAASPDAQQAAQPPAASEHRD